MDDPAVFAYFVRNTLGDNMQQKINAITNFLESFGDLLAVNDGDIECFVKDNHYANESRAAVQRIFIRNNDTQGLKYMFFDLNYIELCNYLSDE